MRKIYLVLLAICFAAMANGQVSVTATAGTVGPTPYTTLGAAFVAINAGTHQGAITIDITANTAEGTTPATLNSSGAGSATYTSINIRPTADGVSIAGNPATAFAVINLNGADNVTIDGDNPNTSGTNQNLTVNNNGTTTLAATIVIRILAHASFITSANSNTIKNCIITGAATARNVAGLTSTTNSENSSMGIYCGYGNATAPTSATSAPVGTTSVTSNGTGTGGTINTLLINNNAINACARAIIFNGASTTVSTGITITNNTIGGAGVLGTYPFTTPTTTVYTRGMWIAGTNALTITGNTLQNILSYVSTTMDGIELNSAIGSGTITISNNIITAVTNNGSSSSANGILISSVGGPFTISGNTISTIQNNATTGSGISIASSGGIGTISENTISGVYSRTTSGFSANGINLGTAANGCIIQNNIIYDLNAVDNNNAASTIGPVGIKLASGTGHKVYHNSVNLYGAALPGGVAAEPSACLMVTNTCTGLDVRNNVFQNTRTGSFAGSVNCAISLTSGLSVSANYTINNNTYFVQTGTNFYMASTNGTSTTYTTANFNPGATSPSTNWRSYTSTLSAAGTNDNASLGFITAAPFTSNTDLHISTGVTPTQLESGGASVGVTTDIDGQVRPGPAGSINGGATAPDIGADEFDGVPLDITPPSISYTPLLGSCTSGSRTLSATITDASGVPTSGAGLPVLYWKINAGSYTAATAVSMGAGVYQFTLGTGSGSGDLISYYIVAQDAASTPNVIASPSTGASGYTASPPAASTAPTTPGSYTNLASLAAGIYGVGGPAAVGEIGHYANLTAAVADYNSKCLGGNVVFALTDPAYSRIAAETFPITINANPAADASHRLTIRPDPTVTSTITGSVASGALIVLNGANYVTIDGSNNGSTSRNLTITNTNTTAPSVISLVSLGVGQGATNNTIKNCNINSGVATSSGFAIAVGGSTPGTSGADNDNVTIQNNSVTNAVVSIYASGTASVSAGGNDNLTITGNTVDYNGTLVSIGIDVGNSLNSSVSQNTVSQQTSGAQAPTGISLETGFVSSTVTRNLITKSLTTNTGGFGGRGITVGTGTATSNLTISNNVIYGVNGSNWSGFSNSSSMGIAIGMVGNSSTISTTAGGINLYFNSVNMSGSMGVGSSTAITTALYIGSGASALNIRDNVLVNTEVGTSTTQKNYAIYSVAAITAFTSINNNDYFVSNSFNAASAIPGFIGSDRVDIAGIQAGFGSNLNSITGDPLFQTNTDLRPNVGSPVVGAGENPNSTGITIDFPGVSRGTPPTIGAYETAADVTGPSITYTAIPNTICLGAPALAATISDGSGVNVASGTAPRLYYRKSTETDAFGNYPADNNSTFNGWKYVEATGSAPNFSFAVDYSKLNSAAATGDNITYFAIAQDLAGTPNVGRNTVTFNGGAFSPTSVNLPSSGATPTTGTLVYSILNTLPTTQPSTANITAGATNAQVLRLDLPSVPCGGTVTQIDFTNASTNLADISKARVYYTTTTTFATTTSFGLDVTSPGATFSVAGTQSLSTTLSNYFWLVYDIDCAAPSVAGNTADASATGITIGGAYTLTPANPTGTRTIVGAVVGDNITSAPTIVVGTAATNAYSISGKTVETGEPSPILNSNGAGGGFTSNYSWSTAISNTQWYKLVVPTSGEGSTGNLIVRATGGDAQIAVWEFPGMPSGCGTTPNFSGAKLLSADDDAIGTTINPTTTAPATRARLVPGNTYYIQIDGYNLVTPSGNVYVEDLSMAPYSIANNGLGNYFNPAGVDMRYASYEVNGADGWTYYYDNAGTATTINDDKVLMATNWSGNSNFYYAGTYLQGTVMVDHIKRDATSVAAPSTTAVLSATDSLIVWVGRNNASAASADLKPTAPYVTTPHWWMMNKFWSLVPKVQPTTAVGVRSYYSDADFTALQTTVIAGAGVLATHTDMQFVKMTKSSTTHYTNAELDPGGGQATILAGTESNLLWANTNGIEAGADPINQAQYNVSVFSGGGGGSTGNPLVGLPSNIISFSGYKDGSRNQLRWTTSSEQNNNGFEVQRSADGINYSSLGFVNTLALGGNSTAQLNYAFTDNNVTGSRQYYRLRQVNFDGNSKLSNIVMIKGDKPVTLIIDGLFPNPANTIVNVLIGAPGKEIVTLVVTDMAGQTVIRQIVSVETGSNTIPVDINRLTNGTYVVKLICSNNCDAVVGKFVKQ